MTDNRSDGPRPAAAAVDLLRSRGYVPAGTTSPRTARLVTFGSFPLTGATVTTGGRDRYELPGTPHRATVGPRLVNLYEYDSGTITNFRQFRSSDVDGIRAALDALKR